MTNPLSEFNGEDIIAAQKYLVSYGIKEVTLDIVTLITVVRQYKLFTEEGANRFESAANNFFKEVALILQAEAEIERLRKSD